VHGQGRCVGLGALALAFAVTLAAVAASGVGRPGIAEHLDDRVATRCDEEAAADDDDGDDTSERKEKMMVMHGVIVAAVGVGARLDGFVRAPASQGLSDRVAMAMKRTCGSRASFFIAPTSASSLERVGPSGRCSPLVLKCS
jgi:hypothetical protein